MVVKPAQAIFASCVAMQNLFMRANSHKNRRNGKKRRHIGAGYMEGIRKSSVHARNVDVLHSPKSTGKEHSSGRCSKIRGNARSVANNLFQEVLEQVKRSADTDCGHPDNALCVHFNEAWQLKVSRRNAGRKESSVNGLLKEFGRLMRRWQWMISAA